MYAIKAELSVIISYTVEKPAYKYVNLFSTEMHRAIQDFCWDKPHIMVRGQPYYEYCERIWSNQNDCNIYTPDRCCRFNTTE